MTTNKPGQNTWNMLAIISLGWGVFALVQIFCSLAFINSSYYYYLGIFLFCGSVITVVPALVTGFIAVMHYEICNKAGKISAIAGLVMGSFTLIVAAYWYFRS